MRRPRETGGPLSFAINRRCEEAIAVLELYAHAENRSDVGLEPFWRRAVALSIVSDRVDGAVIHSLFALPG